MPLVISIPYYLSIYNLSFLNCYFESVSGFTSTGFSINQRNTGAFHITGKGNSEFVPVLIRSQDGSSTKELLPDEKAVGPRVKPDVVIIQVFSSSEISVSIFVTHGSPKG